MEKKLIKALPIEEKNTILPSGIHTISGGTHGKKEI